MKRVARHLNVIKKNTIDLISEEELAKKLERSFLKKKPLRVKIGFDPTARDIHLGHTVLLRKLRAIQDLGHLVYFIIGDFTAQIGDPSGRKDERPVLTKREIVENARTYTQQAFQVLDKRKTKVIYNSRWYRDLTLSAFLPLLSRYTVARTLERDDFTLRLKEGRPLTLLEFIYPLIQGYDSVKMNADIELGGSDQKFNLIVGRHLQESFGQEAQIVVTLPLLVGLDGHNKMSKSLGNYIGITEEPLEMFGKVMSISDETMWEYTRLLTDLDLAALKTKHPKEAKLILAETIVCAYYSLRVAKSARQEFEKVFSKKELPSDIPVYQVSHKEVDVVEVIFSAKLVSSKNEARRLLEQRGISQEGIPLEKNTLTVSAQGTILKVGKRRFLKIVYTD